MALFSRNNLSRVKDGAYVINLDNKNIKAIYWVSLFIDRNKARYFESWRIEYIPQELSNKIKGKSITYDILRTQDNKFIMRRFYCIAFIEYMI